MTDIARLKQLLAKAGCGFNCPDMSCVSYGCKYHRPQTYTSNGAGPLVTPAQSAQLKTEFPDRFKGE